MDTHEWSAILEKFSQIASGDLRPEVEEIVEILRKQYEPQLEAVKEMASVLRDEMPEASEVLRRFHETWKGVSGGIIQEFEKILVEQRHIRGDYAKYDEVHRRIAEAEKLMACTDELFEMLDEFRTRLLSSQKADNRT